MKYDDASWHYGGEFPSGSPEEFGGTHIALFLRYCFSKGWAGELHSDSAPDAVAAVVAGEMSATEFLFKYCDGKFTDEDLNADGNHFASDYYGEGGLYLSDYIDLFEELMYVAPESEHNFSDFCALLERRLETGKLKKRKGWKFWQK